MRARPALRALCSEPWLRPSGSTSPPSTPARYGQLDPALQSSLGHFPAPGGLHRGRWDANVSVFCGPDRVTGVSKGARRLLIMLHRTPCAAGRLLITLRRTPCAAGCPALVEQSVCLWGSERYEDTPREQGPFWDESRALGPELGHDTTLGQLSCGSSSAGGFRRTPGERGGCTVVTAC